MTLFGAPLRRFEDARFLTGRGDYVADRAPSGALRAVFLRSPHAHANLLSVNVEAARAMPGVRLILTGADLAAAGIGSLRCANTLAGAEIPLREPPRPCLATDRVRHVGEAVALVVAETEAQALDAAEFIAADYDALPAVTDPLDPAGPALHDVAPDNIAFLWGKGDSEAVRDGFVRAARVIEAAIPNPRVTCAPIEPRAALAWEEGGRLHLLCNGQAVHGMRAQIASAMALEPDRLRVVAPDVGGGFGVKNVAFPEHIALLHATRLLGAPIRWISTQAEDFAASAHGRALHGTARLALDAEGRMLALDVQAVAEMGAYLSLHGPHCPTNAASTAMGGCYDIPAIRFSVRGVFTNAAPIEAYRGAGKPEANFLIESLIEQAGEERHALRARNLIASHPHRTALGMNILEGAFPERLQEAERLADRAGFADRRKESEARGRLRGFGLTCFLETARGTPGEWARLRMQKDGSVELAVGTQSNGQGHETSFPQYAATLLDLPPEQFRYVQADTDRIARGNGHGGARSLHMGGEAIRLAAAAMLASARTAAARLLQCDPNALHYAAGRFTLTDCRGLELAEVAALEGALEGEAAHGVDLVTFPNGAHAAEVEVDPETGEVVLLSYLAVDDYGRVLNPLLLRGSVQGGLAQGIGQALMERIAYDGDGQLLSAGFSDYAMPRAADLPDLRVELREDHPTEANGLGVKGSGQAGCIAAPQAVMAAIRDALGADITMPASPEKIWRAINSRPRAPDPR
ncbi:xanthine dehydrogenase family protein molybdopterin-binding subunit [Sabulicella rubraurantiaca]|uniref:xanthine dehydrogenase family protein molybdopterin-binding subunit n=1 Tax=Sabulicella rubraurantiaca TaxID=2811429 RepID=UPI001A97384C|nr:xanthine dehydrogenase family protein molybdopterin-binding subunit [Sabulicella rubraurantiaca]